MPVPCPFPQSQFEDRFRPYRVIRQVHLPSLDKVLSFKFLASQFVKVFHSALHSNEVTSTIPASFGWRAEAECSRFGLQKPTEH